MAQLFAIPFLYTLIALIWLACGKGIEKGKRGRSNGCRRRLASRPWGGLGTSPPHLFLLLLCNSSLWCTEKGSFSFSSGSTYALVQCLAVVIEVIYDGSIQELGNAGGVIVIIIITSSSPTNINLMIDSYFPTLLLLLPSLLQAGSQMREGGIVTEDEVVPLLSILKVRRTRPSQLL